ncbi:hypothetical protein EL22_01715 [Halostagnicola sp. A56]|uniref:DUF7344 domain-containing protein n=1 Tax=Halostagnicola sp. A56 TaxID=1495067 RepID=UPI00049F036A|nr:hypothetical protein [Halostagnicola sp. A56]KDE58861.1 hypothetical protein EL22_01715 [Halostagnicola sp. A56]
MGVGGENEFRRRSVESGSSTEPTDRPTVISKDDAFHLLQTSRRRDVVRYMARADGRVELRDLAEQVAAWEEETTVESLSSSDRQRVYISLYQTHLPKLDEHGIVDYDKDRGIVERRRRARQLESYLAVDPVDTAPDPWPRRYGVAVLLCVVFTGASIHEFGVGPSTGLALLVLATVGAVAVGHWWSKRDGSEPIPSVS